MARMAMFATRITLASLELMAAPVSAEQELGNDGIAPVPTPQQTMPEEEVISAYPANYVEEVAQSLGIKSGKVDVFEVRPRDDGNT